MVSRSRSRSARRRSNGPNRRNSRSRSRSGAVIPMTGGRGRSRTPPRSSPQGRLEQAVNVIQDIANSPVAMSIASSLGGSLYDQFWGGSSAAGGRKRGRGGTYVGKFRKPSKKAVSSALSMKAAKGFVHTSEVSGQLDDPNCVYLVHMALDPTQVIQMIVQVLIRKLLVRHGMDVGSVNQEVAVSDPNNSAGMQIRLIASNNEPGSEASQFSLQTYDTVDNRTISQIAAIFVDNFMQYSSGYTTTQTTGNASNNLELFSFQLYLLQAGVWVRSMSEIKFHEETVHVYGKSVMKVQNRTQNGSGTDDADYVNSNPLTGKIYEFKGVPKPKVDGMFALTAVPLRGGVKVIRAAEFTNPIVTTSMKEPPMPKIFNNCIGASKVTLNPGNVKSMSVRTSIKKKLLPFLKQIRYQAGVSGFQTTYSIFKSQMIALEDLINVDVAELITVAYEVNRETGISLKTSKSTTTISDYAQTTLNNFTPT